MVEFPEATPSLKAAGLLANEELRSMHFLETKLADEELQ